MADNTAPSPPPEKFCKGCGKKLEQRPTERRQNFAERTYCNYKCFSSRPIIFDPAIHCGAPAKYRDPDILKARLQFATRAIANLKPTASNYEKNLAYHERVIRVSSEQLEKLEKHPDDRPCVNPKGHMTDHKGEGFCHFHCKCHGHRGWHEISGNAYQQIRNRKIKDALALVEQQTVDILDLVPEMKLLKALAIVYLEDLQRRKKLTENDLNSATNVLDKIGKTAERINYIQLKAGVVTLPAVIQLTAGMANEMMFLAQESDGKVFDARRFIEDLRARWSNLSIDANAKRVPLSAHSLEAV